MTCLIWKFFSVTQCSHALTWCINAIERKQIFKKKRCLKHIYKRQIIHAIPARIIEKAQRQT